MKKLTSGIMTKFRLNVSGKNGVLDGATCFKRITAETYNAWPFHFQRCRDWPAISDGDSLLLCGNALHKLGSDIDTHQWQWPGLATSLVAKMVIYFLSNFIVLPETDYLEDCLRTWCPSHARKDVSLVLSLNSPLSRSPVIASDVTSLKLITSQISHSDTA